MTSRPLFMSVAESTVILPPIAHVGWRNASSTVTPDSSSRDRPRNGPPEAVIEATLERVGAGGVHGFDSLYAADAEARAVAGELIAVHA